MKAIAEDILLAVLAAAVEEEAFAAAALDP
jgi:hypothetical protein